VLPGLPPIRILERQELSASATTVTLPASGTISDLTTPLDFTARHLVVLINAQTDDAARTVTVQFNGDTGSNYNHQLLQGEDSTTTAARVVDAASLSLVDIPASGDLWGGGFFLVPHAFGTANQKPILSMGGEAENDVRVITGRWASNAAITSVVLGMATDDFEAGSVLTLAVIDESYSVGESILGSDGALTIADLDDLSSQQGDISVIGYMRSDRSAVNDTLDIILNADSTSGNYNRQLLEGTATTRQASTASDNVIGICDADSATANFFSGGIMSISAFGAGTNDPALIALTGDNNQTSSFTRIVVARRNNVEAVTTITLDPSTGSNMKAGSGIWAYHVPKQIIGRTELGGDTASVTFSDIPQNFDALRLSVYARTDNDASASDSILLSLNADTTNANYQSQTLNGVTSSASAGAAADTRRLLIVAGGTATANVFDGGSVLIPQYAKTDRHKHMLSISGVTGFLRLRSNRWKNTAAITSIAITELSSNSFKAGSIFILEGISEETFHALQVVFE
jgi:hypothetical protein